MTAFLSTADVAELDQATAAITAVAERVNAHMVAHGALGVTVQGAATFGALAGTLLNAVSLLEAATILAELARAADL